MIQAAAAVALAGGLAVWAAVGIGGSAGLLVWLGAASTLLIAVAVVVGWPGLLAGGVAGVVGLCTVAVVAHPSPAALAVGVAAFAMAELTFSALDQGPSAVMARPAGAQRRRFVGAVVALSVIVGGVAILAGRDGTSEGGAGLEALGLVAVTGVAGLVVVLARGAHRPPGQGQ